MHRTEELDVLEESLGFNKQVSQMLTFSWSSTLEKCHSSPRPLKTSLTGGKNIPSVILLATYPFSENKKL